MPSGCKSGTAVGGWLPTAEVEAAYDGAVGAQPMKEMAKLDAGLAGARLSLEFFSALVHTHFAWSG